MNPYMIHASTSAPSRLNRLNKTPPSLNKIFEDVGIEPNESKKFEEVFHIDPYNYFACTTFSQLKFRQVRTMCLNNNLHHDTQKKIFNKYVDQKVDI